MSYRRCDKCRKRKAQFEKFHGNTVYCYVCIQYLIPEKYKVKPVVEINSLKELTHFLCGG